MRRRKVGDWIFCEDDPSKFFGRAPFQIGNADLLRWRAAVEAEYALMTGK